MLQRKVHKQLIEWKNKPSKMTLLVKGARQIGKTFSIIQFAREQYPYCVYINFDENPAYRAIFEGDLDMNTLIKQISLRVPGAELVPRQM